MLARENFNGLQVWHNGEHFFGMLKKAVQQGHSE